MIFQKLIDKITFKCLRDAQHGFIEASQAFRQSVSECHKLQEKLRLMKKEIKH